MADWQLETDLPTPRTETSNFYHRLLLSLPEEIAALMLCYDGCIQTRVLLYPIEFILFAE